MKLAVLTAGFYDKDYDQKFEKLKKTCEIFKIDPIVYGRGEFFSFFDSKINKLGVQVNNLKGKYTHVLYTDFADSLFLTNLGEIERIYQRKFDSTPLLVSGEKTVYPFPEYAPLFAFQQGVYKFMNPGNFIGEIDAVLEAIGHCKKYYTLQSNDQGHWYKAYSEYKFPLKVDTNAEIFQTMADCEYEQEFTLKQGVLYNKLTGNAPCIVHFNGPKGDGTLNNKLMQEIFDDVVENYNYETI